MNSAQVAFLDFERPRCWILALSWNELNSGSFFRLRTATFWTSGQKWCMHSLGRELKKKSFYKKDRLTDRLNLFYLPWKSPRAYLSPFFWYLWIFEYFQRSRLQRLRSRSLSRWPKSLLALLSMISVQRLFCECAFFFATAIFFSWVG